MSEVCSVYMHTTEKVPSTVSINMGPANIRGTLTGPPPSAGTSHRTQQWSATARSRPPTVMPLGPASIRKIQKSSYKPIVFFELVIDAARTSMHVSSELLVATSRTC